MSNFHNKKSYENSQNIGWEIELKLPVNEKRDLSLIYTPGVGECCLEIQKNAQMAMELTNKANSIAICAFELNKYSAFQKASEYRQKGFDAYPIIFKKSKVETRRIIESLVPTFGFFDISLIDEIFDTSKINTQIPQQSLSFSVPDMSKMPNDLKKASVELHKITKGIIKQKISENEPRLVGVISNGTAVLGFGKIGPYAALPVMEGKAALFKKFGQVDAIPICIDAIDLHEFKEIVKALEPTFCGINLEDICAPDCFEVEEELISEMNIPIFHDDQHGTAIVVLAGLINALKLANKNKEDIKIVFSGAGAAAIAVCKLFLAYGIKNIILSDLNGSVFEGRKENDAYLEQIAKKTNPTQLKGSLSDIIYGADVFVGLSAKGVLRPEMIAKMNEKPIIFALANPEPEILPEEAQKAGAFIIATGRSDFPNQVNNSLVFPGIFKGILNSNVKIIDNKIKLKAANLIAQKVEKPTIYEIIPDSMDLNTAKLVSQAVQES